MGVLLASFVAANTLTVFLGTIIDEDTNQPVGSGYKVEVYCYQANDPNTVHLVDTVYTTSSGSFSASLNNLESPFQCIYGDYGYIIVEDEFRSGDEMILQDCNFNFVRIDQRITVPEFSAITLSLAGLASLLFFMKRRK